MHVPIFQFQRVKQFGTDRSLSIPMGSRSLDSRDGYNYHRNYCVLLACKAYSTVAAAVNMDSKYCWNISQCSASLIYKLKSNGNE